MSCPLTVEEITLFGQILSDQKTDERLFQELFIFTTCVVPTYSLNHSPTLSLSWVLTNVLFWLFYLLIICDRSNVIATATPLSARPLGMSNAPGFILSASCQLNWHLPDCWSFPRTENKEVIVNLSAASKLGLYNCPAPEPPLFSGLFIYALYPRATEQGWTKRVGGQNHCWMMKQTIKTSSATQKHVNNWPYFSCLDRDRESQFVNGLNCPLTIDNRRES